MDEQKENVLPEQEEMTPETPAEECAPEVLEEEKPVYIPRPMWQVWGARVCLVLFVIVVILYYIKIARGG